MPEKDGAEVIFDLQIECPGIKMIVITGGGQGDAQAYLKSIMAHSDVKCALEKPFTMDELLKSVKKCLIINLKNFSRHCCGVVRHACDERAYYFPASCPCWA